MLKQTVVEYFGNNQSAVARALKISRSWVSEWPELVPEKQALKLDRLTNGELKYDEALYQKNTAVVAA